MEYLYSQLGRVLSTREVARYLGLDCKTVRKYYAALGGVRLGRTYLFFEREVVNAIQARKTLGGSGVLPGPEVSQDVPHQGGSDSVGSRPTAKVTDRYLRVLDDPHHIFG